MSSFSTSDEFIKAPNLTEVFTSNKAAELIRCKKDPIYFAETYVKIQHPVKGAVPFVMFDYQKEMLRNYQNNRYSISLLGRQMGKTASAAAYLLWFAMFHEDKTILITANLMAAALEIMDRIRYAYEELPLWVKAGVTVYNKGTLAFDNGSKIVSRATTANAGRGLSISLLYCDEFAFVPPRISEEFWTAIQPTLSTGGSCIITSTPNSDEDQFAQLWFGAIDNLDEYGNVRPNGIGKNGFKSTKAIWSAHPDRDEVWANEQRAKLGDEKFRRENECEFIQADETLIDSMTLMRLGGIDPVKVDEKQVRWYSEPIANRTYLCALDPAMGTGGDFSAIQVFQLPEMIQVAEWKHNRTATKAQVAILQHILIKIESLMLQDRNQQGEPEIYWTLENNSLGEAPLVVIADTGEENFPGVFIHEPKNSHTGRRSRKGLNTTFKTKVPALARIKSLIESDRMKIKSKALVSELKNFVSGGNGSKIFKAKYGAHDDLISATILCVRIMQLLSRRDPDFNEDLKEIIMDDDDKDFAGPLPTIV